MGENEQQVRELERQFIEKIKKEGSPHLKTLATILETARKEVEHFTREIVVKLQLDFSFTHNSYEQMKLSVKDIRDIIFK